MEQPTIQFSRVVKEQLLTGFNLHIECLVDYTDPNGNHLRILLPYKRKDRGSVARFLQACVFDPLVKMASDAERSGDMATSAFYRNVVLSMWLFDLFPSPKIVRKTPFRSNRLEETPITLKPEGELIKESHAWMKRNTNVVEGILRLGGDPIGSDVLLFQRAVLRHEIKEEVLNSSGYKAFSREILDQVEGAAESWHTTETSKQSLSSIRRKFFEKNEELFILMAQETAHHYWNTLNQAFRTLYRKERKHISPELTRWEKRLFQLLYFKHPKIMPYPFGFDLELVWGFIEGVEQRFGQALISYLLFKIESPEYTPKQVHRIWRAYLALYPFFAELEREEQRLSWKHSKQKAQAFKEGRPLFKSLDEPIPNTEEETGNSPDHELMLKQIIDRLPPKYRKVFRGVHLEGKTQGEVACQLRIHQSTVSRYLKEAEQRVRELLEETIC